jgi:hypothetical protein
MTDDDNVIQFRSDQNESVEAADVDSSTVENLPQKNRNENGQPPHRRFLPIEADEILKRKIEKDSSMTLEHVLTLNELMLAYHYPEEKNRIFGIVTPNEHVFDLVDRLLDLAIEEMQLENATVVGVVLKLIQLMIEGDRVMRKYVMGAFLYHAKSSAEIKAEMACVSKTLARLKEDFEAALKRERARPLA